MQNFENAIILTAGFGSRLGQNTPKSLVEVNGKKIIDYQLELIKDIKNIIVVVGFKSLDVVEYVSKIRQDIIFVKNFAYEKTGPLHSLKIATNFIKKPFLVFDGDTLFNNDNYQNFIHKCKSINFQSNVIGITKTTSEQPVFAHLDESTNKIIELSRTKYSIYEFCGPYFISDDIEIVNNKEYIFEFLSNKLPIDYCILDVYEIDTPSDLHYTIKNFK
jgi:choline kinase